MRKYIGYSKEDHLLPYAKFYNENIEPLSPKVEESVRPSPFPPHQLLSFHDSAMLMNDGYHSIENGYSLESDGSARVAVLTDMPGATPQMWDWWFRWHGCRADRYKLWHPKAHQSAQWKDGRDDLVYIRRISVIEEIIGKSMEKVFIRFVDPKELGLKNDDQTVFICARTGFSQVPLDFGWLVHQVRKTTNGSEMRSRFWMGGEHIAIRSDSFLAKQISGILQKLRSITKQQAHDLTVHCSEEMKHLSVFLPQLYNEFK